MRYYITPLIVLLLSIPIAHAGVFGGSNLGFSGYPESSCFKPSKPTKPYSSDRWQIESYNMQVQQYNSAWNLYISCVKEYLEDANNDIKRIQEKMEEEIDKVKAPY